MKSFLLNCTINSFRIIRTSVFSIVTGPDRAKDYRQPPAVCLYDSLSTETESQRFHMEKSQPTPYRDR